jgi:hypothetical protein
MFNLRFMVYAILAITACVMFVVAGESAPGVASVPPQAPTLPQAMLPVKSSSCDCAVTGVCICGDNCTCEGGCNKNLTSTQPIAHSTKRAKMLRDGWTWDEKERYWWKYSTDTIQSSTPMQSTPIQSTYAPLPAAVYAPIPTYTAPTPVTYGFSSYQPAISLGGGGYNSSAYSSAPMMTSGFGTYGSMGGMGYGSPSLASSGFGGGFSRGYGSSSFGSGGGGSFGGACSSGG